MAIDMKTVKEIEFNNKQVKKIEDNNGNILWQKQDGQTVTITFTNLKYIRLYYRTYSYSSTLYGYLNYLNITGVYNSRTTDAFVLLPVSVYTDIKNKVYTTDTTITGQNSFSSGTTYAICYVLNNELYSVGNTNSGLGDAVGTTSELSNFRQYSYGSATLNPGGSSNYLYGGYYMRMPSTNSIVMNSNRVVTTNYPGDTYGGTHVNLAAASGTMTLQYTI